MLNYGLCWNEVCSNICMSNWCILKYLHVEFKYVEKCVCWNMILLKNLYVHKCVDRTTTSQKMPFLAIFEVLKFDFIEFVPFFKAEMEK